MSLSNALSEPRETDRALADELADISRRLHTLTEGVGLDGDQHDGAHADIEALLSAATRLYAAHAADGEQQPLSEQIASTTETVMLVSALMQAQNLNTFDLALWQSKLRRS